MAKVEILSASTNESINHADRMGLLKKLYLSLELGTGLITLCLT